MKKMNVHLSVASIMLIIMMLLSGCEVFYPSQLEEDYQANILSTTADFTTTQSTTSQAVTTSSTAKTTAKSTAKSTASAKVKATTTTKPAKEVKPDQPNNQSASTEPPTSSSSSYSYDQLSKSDREIYKSIESGIKGCRARIRIANRESLDPDTVFNIYFAVLADHPEFFHVGKQVGFEFDGKDTYITNINLDENGNQLSTYNASTYKSMKSKLDKIVNKLISATSSMNDYEKVKYYHDYIVLNTDYVSGRANSHNLYGALIEGKAVCEGYARALQYLCNKSGIECLFVTGRSKDEYHGWNLVKLGGEFYHIDPTWNDPTGSPADYITYTYFGLTDKQISADHFFSDADRPVSHYKKLPAAKGTKYNYYKYNKLYFTDASTAQADLTKVILNAAKKKQKYVEIKYAKKSTFDKAYDLLKSSGYYNALNAAAEKNKTISTQMNSFRYNDKHYTITFEINYK